MEPVRKRGRSEVWEHFELLPSNKVKCLVCSQQLAYNNNTSSMLRHFRAKHENIPCQSRTTLSSTQGIAYSFLLVYIFYPSSQQMLDSALVNMIVKDLQPFTIVDDAGFREFVGILDPTYVIPSRKALKSMVEAKYTETKEKAKEEVQKATAVSLTSDMWTSIHMDAYLAITCHLINEKDELSTFLLGVGKFPKSHSAENLAEVKTALMAEWGIQKKVRCLVTDAAPNMVACAGLLKMRHTICIAHALNLIVKKAIDQTPGLEHIRSKARKIAGYFRSSTTAKERLFQMQGQMGRPTLKLIQEVETRWNSTFAMLQRMYQQREPVGAALVTLKTDLTPLTSEEYHTINECLGVLSTFNEATTELSEERRVSGSKVIPLIRMLRHALNTKQSQAQDEKSIQLCSNLFRLLNDRVSSYETMSIMTLATLLDPRYKTVGFCSQSNAQAAVKRLTGECATVIRIQEQQNTPSTSSATSQPQLEATVASSSTTPSTGTPYETLFLLITVMKINATADATVEVQRYLSDPIIPRTEDPLRFWASQKNVYPHLYHLALEFLCTPASSVPCERIFSKAGEVVTKKRNQLNPSTVEKILFLNKN
ncbi:zinc finger BED domain-containing protein 4-like [Astyanax mexicanus]|uniref:Zinc finger BED domain-containing protein 4-like n=1 Tax=Astyanax mexicanus TaxID=7994 RepID=A0A8T2KR28_ASTMX|nr:zinc finger BED domain-containing protein 4-like [Astyanax mexicanus]KAG9273466.1 zinc finger BED domain-containing protein 4-like [Astyanax mexicanus]